MNLLEHEAKKLLSDSGLIIPDGRLVKNRSELAFALSFFQMPVMLKAQVPIGGRGKAGAIRRADDHDQALTLFDELMTMKVKGYEVGSVLIEPYIAHYKELYLALAVDREVGRPVLLCDMGGGMDVESQKNGAVWRGTIDPIPGLDEHLIDEAFHRLGMIPEARLEFKMTLSSLWDLFVGLDCELVEINPLVMIDGHHFLCLDAKIVINDDSLFRHADLLLDPDIGRTSFEVACSRSGLIGVELDGDISVIANGAGLTMAVLDELDLIGLKGGAFLDLGGADDPSKISKAISIVLDRKSLQRMRGLLICVFGGITRCDIVAQGIIDALRGHVPDVPIVIRLRGVNEAKGRELLEGYGLKAFSDLEGACFELYKAVGGSK